MNEAKEKERAMFEKKLNQLDEKEIGEIICMLPPQDKALFLADKFVHAPDEIKQETLDVIDGFLRDKKQKK